jgi:hypothetical protein
MQIEASGWSNEAHWLTKNGNFNSQSNDEFFPVHSGIRATTHPTPADIRLLRRAPNVVNRNQ